MSPTEVMHKAMPFTALMGIEAVSSGNDEVRARIAWHESRCTSGGLLHGGSAAQHAALDAAFAGPAPSCQDEF